MESALTNAIAVASVTPKSFLLFYSELHRLKALFVTPKAYFTLDSAVPLPPVSGDVSSLQAVLSQCKARVELEARRFTLSGYLSGGGACCAKGTGLELEPKKQSKWGDLIRKVSQATDRHAVKTELKELKSALQSPSLDEFREIIDEMAKVTWRNVTGRNSAIKYLKLGAESLFLVSHSTGLMSSPPLCERVQNGLTQMRHRTLTGTTDEVLSECYLDLIASGLQEVSEGAKSEHVTAVRTALQSESPGTVTCDAPVFQESLMGAALPLTLVAKHPALKPMLDPLYLRLNEVPWQVQALLAHRIMRVQVADGSHEELGGYFAKYLEPLLLQREGQNSWKVRVVAVQALGHFLRSGAAETPKEVASGCILKALEREANEQVLSQLQQLPRTFLNPSMICTALAGAGSGGVFNFKSGELRFFENPLLHGTARAVASLSDTMILTGGVLAPKKCYEIDFATMKVRELAMMNCERFYHGACLVGLDVVVCGGRSFPDGEAQNTAEKLVGDKWLTLPNMKYKRESHSCAGWGSAVYAVGGLGDDESPVTIEVLEQGDWRVLSVKLSAPLLVPGVYLKSADEMVLGGGRAEVTLSAVQVLNLKTGSAEKLPDLPHPSAFSSDLVEMRDNSLFFLSSESRELFQLSLATQQWTVKEY